jgi:hypothetical protein
MPSNGIISASMAPKIMTRGTKGDAYGKTFDSLARQIGAQRVGYDTSPDISHLSAVEWGIENEWLAVESYQERTFAEVNYTGESQVFTLHPVIRYVGATPDGYIGTDGLLEIKCPNSSNHLDNLLDDAQLDQYRPQLQFQLWVTGRKWVDWVSFDPRAPEPLQLHIVRVERDEALIAELEQRCDELNKRADAVARELKERFEL